MSENLLRVLELLLLVLVYLFFLRVLRAVWTELKSPQLAATAGGGVQPARGGPAPAPAKQKRRHRHAAPTAVLVMGTAQRYALQDVITLGRAAGCQIVVDDTYVSQVHARIFTRDGDAFVEDLASTNGTYLNRQKLTAPRQLQRGDQIQLGTTVLEVQ